MNTKEYDVGARVLDHYWTMQCFRLAYSIVLDILFLASARRRGELIIWSNAFSVMTGNAELGKKLASLQVGVV